MRAISNFIDNISLLFDIEIITASFILNTSILFIYAILVYIYKYIIKKQVKHIKYLNCIENICELIQGINIVIYIALMIMFLLSCSIYPIIFFNENFQYTFLFMSLKFIIMHLIVYLLEMGVSRSIQLSGFSDTLLWTISLFTMIYVC